MTKDQEIACLRAFFARLDRDRASTAMTKPDIRALLPKIEADLGPLGLGQAKASEALHDAAETETKLESGRLDTERRDKARAERVQRGEKVEHEHLKDRDGKYDEAAALVESVKAVLFPPPPPPVIPEVVDGIR